MTRLLRLLPILALLSFQTGCQTPEGFPVKLEGRGAVVDQTQSLAGSGLEELQPGDIVLAPLRNQSEAEEVPLDELREAFQDCLVDRLYSPLDLAFVDAHWAESSFRGAAPPDAVLVVSVTHWDASLLASSGKLAVSAELRLFEGGSTTGRPLWGVALTRNLELATDPRRPEPSQMLLAKGIDLFTEEALSHLPERDPLAAAR